MDYGMEDYPEGDYNDTNYYTHTTNADLLGYVFTPIGTAALVLYTLVFILGVLGNGAVIWVTGVEMKRTVNTVWFLNLAVADLLCCLALPFLAMPLIRDHHWALGDFPCKLLPSLTILNMFASVFVLTAISVDRCALVTLPIWCQNHRSARLAWGVCGAAWLLSLLLTLPSFIFRKIKAEVFAVKVMCVLDYASVSGHQHATEVATAALRFVCGFLMPFVVICTCYGLLLARISKSRFGRSRKTLKVVVVVVVGFFVCWLPYHISGLIMASKLSHDPLFQRIHHIDPLIVGVAYINSCINPIIYVLVGQDFKAKFRRSLRGLLREALTEDLPSTGDSKARTRSTMDDKSTTTTI